jgi:hypothetical protein
MNRAFVPTDQDEAALAFETPPMDATDHDVAIGMREGRYASPQAYGAFWLFDLRITGTGMAYRDSIEEWAHRHPDTWLTDEFVARCNGLPVIFGHPEKSGLTSDEYRERSIGSIVLPYIKGDEVWGIAKIFDADSALLMQTTHRSTSPGVTPPKGSTPVLLEYGTDAQEMGIDAATSSVTTKVLDEALPLILDHLAVCEAGVWDKDGPPEGIRLDTSSRKDTTVADEDLQAKLDAAIAERDDARMKLDALKLDSAKADEAETEGESVEKAEKSEGEKIADSEESDKLKETEKDVDEDKIKAAVKKDAAAVETVDVNRGMNDSKALRTELDAAKGELSSLRSIVDGLKRQPTSEDRDQIAKAFTRADSLYQMLGDETPATYPGESPIAYRRRLATGLRKYTDSYKAYVLHDSVDATAFGLLESAIYAEALEAAKHPVINDANEGVLREIKTVEFGKQVSRFQGDSNAAWLPFMPAKRHFFKSFNTAPDRR